MTKPSNTILICSNGINRGCGSLAVAADEILTGAGYNCVHCSSKGSLNHIQAAGKKVYQVIGYNEKMKRDKVDNLSCVVDYFIKNIRYTLSEHANIAKIIDEHLPIACVSVFEGFAAYACYYRGIPIIEFSDMLFFKLRLHKCTDTERDFAANYLLGLDLTMAPYTRGCALSLVPHEIEGCGIHIPDNCVVSGPLLAHDVQCMQPLPRSQRNRVTVYVSGATEKCEWLYKPLSRMTEHRFVVFVGTGEKTWCKYAGGNVEIYSANRQDFIESLMFSYACITNAGLQTAAEALHLQVFNFMLPSSNHHAQCAVAESVQRAGGGMACLRLVKSKSKRCTDFETDMRRFLDLARVSNWNVKYATALEGPAALLHALQDVEGKTLHPHSAIGRHMAVWGGIMCLVIVLILILAGIGKACHLVLVRKGP